MACLLLSTWAQAGTYSFGVTKEFCDSKFDGKIAKPGEPYNVTDVIDSNLYSRRIVDEFVTSTVAYIWYEHGGRGYHQHLVRFNVTKPSEVIENYTFYKTEYESIFDLIKNRQALNSELGGEL